MGEFSRPKDFKVAFVLTEPLLREAVRLIDENTTISLPFLLVDEKIGYQVELRDGAGFTTTSLDEVLELSNRGAQQIEGITVYTASHIAPIVRLTFRTSQYRPVSYEVTGSEEKAFYLSTKLEELIDRSKPWYSWIARPTRLFGTVVVVYLSILAAFSLPFIEAITGSDINPNAPVAVQRSAVILYYLLYLALGMVGGLFLVFKRTLMPPAQFAIREGFGRIEQRKVWRQAIGVVVVVGFIIAVVGSVVGNYLTK